MIPNDDSIGLYCHIPFCASSCDFCAFYQEKPRRADIERYLEGMEREFALIPEDRPMDTIFWGGGTPGLLSAGDLDRLGRALVQRLNQMPREWTVEMAPSTVKADKLRILRDLGVTRISMGVQSFQKAELEALGRLHHPRQIYRAWDLIQAAGFEQTNLDLMFALPGQSMKQWEASIKEAARLGPNHLSTYCLTFEEDTALYVKLSAGMLSIDETRERQFYERAWERLAELGYAQYEISNFSRDGGQCLHNLNTWTMGEWLGLGPSAASQLGGRRFQRPANLSSWAEAVVTGEGRETEAVELDHNLLLTDAVIFGLRLNQGINLFALSQRFYGATNAPAIESLLLRFRAEGLVTKEAGTYRATHRGRLVCDAMGSALIEESDCPRVPA